MFFDDSIPMDYRYLFTTLMKSSSFAVPRDRPLNAAELLVMPFDWQVWIEIALIFVLAEITKHVFPTQILNDPFLLVVCGLERHDLHRAGRWEKIIFLPLIILMFFVSNAFETKVVSLMISKPSIHKIKTLDDLRQSGLKIFVDLENNPHYANDTLLGSMVVQGTLLELNDAVPNTALRWDTDLVDALKDITFDYERMQPFYVVLDQTIYEGPELYSTSTRNQLIKDLRFVHITLVESGLMSLWKRQWGSRLRRSYIGKRSRPDINDKVELNFDDMKTAWIIWGIGMGVSTVGFILEQLKQLLCSLTFATKRDQWSLL